jgi:hypothetical protein
MREKLLFDFGWRFHPGDIKQSEPIDKISMYRHAKTERAQWGPAAYSYNEDDMKNTEYWETVDLPHDYIISQIPDKNNNCTLGYFKYHNAWYRNRFRLDDSDRNKRITILFEGVATHATVYVNGCLMARNFCGYTSFEVDVTDVVRFNEDNIVAVYVEAADHEGWWYEQLDNHELFHKLVFSLDKRRHEVRPGLSGLAQISGRNAISWEERFNLDIEYIDSLSFINDWKIIFLTIKKVFEREGISSVDTAIMRPFEGNDKVLNS